MTDLELLLTCLAIIAVGIILFVLTGFIGVKKGWIAVIEKMEIFVCTTTKRWTYFTPLLYRRVGMYPLASMTKPVEVNGHKFMVTYRILDVKAYHYSGHDIQGAVRLAYKGPEVPTQENVKTVIQSIGCECIDVKG